MNRRAALQAAGLGIGLTVLRSTPARASAQGRYLNDFGPVGASDDSATFAAALAAIPLGGTILIPNGDYRTSAATTLGSDQRLEGESVGGTKIIYTGSGQGIRTALNVHRSGIENLTVDGLNNVNADVIGVFINGASSCAVRNVQIRNFRGSATQPGSGLRIDAPAGGQGYFNHCEHVDATSNGYGLRLTSNGGNWANANVFDNCGASSNTRDGFRIEGTSVSGIRITGGQSSYNGGDGLNIDGSRHLIWGLWLESNGGFGLRNNCGSPQSSVWSFIATGNALGDAAGVVPGALYLQGSLPRFT